MQYITLFFKSVCTDIQLYKNVYTVVSVTVQYTFDYLDLNYPNTPKHKQFTSMYTQKYFQV